MDDGSRQPSATAFAPASIGNVAVGFDVLGCAVDVLGDRVRVRRIEEPTVRIAAITGVATALPRDPEANTATVGLLHLIRDRELTHGFEVTIEKGIPLGSGLGGSAASAVAAIRAASALVDPPLSRDDMLRYALLGEQVASGAIHADNVAPSLFGGLVLTRSTDPPDVISLPVPDTIRCVLVRPMFEIATRDARRVVPLHVALDTAVQHSANLAGFVAGCMQSDLNLIRRSFNDVLVEPHRAHFIPGFRAAQQAALDAGALGCSISGAGPTMFAWSTEPASEHVCAAMCTVFADEELETESWISDVALTGAHLEE